MPRCPECSEELRGDEVVCPNCLARLSPDAMIGAAAPAAVLSPLPPQREPAVVGQPARPGYSRGASFSSPQQSAGGVPAAARPSARRLVRAVTLFTAGVALLLIGVVIGQVWAPSRPAEPTFSPLDEGTALYQQGRYQAAEYAFGRAADAGLQRGDATAAPALAMMGWSAYRAGDYAGAGDQSSSRVQRDNWAGSSWPRLRIMIGLGLIFLKPILPNRPSAHRSPIGGPIWSSMPRPTPMWMAASATRNWPSG